MKGCGRRAHRFLRRWREDLSAILSYGEVTVIARRRHGEVIKSDNEGDRLREFLLRFLNPELPRYAFHIGASGTDLTTNFNHVRRQSGVL